MLRYVFQYKFSILLAFVIILLSLLPAEDFPFNSIYRIPHIDKMIHIAMYASLGFIALMESRCSGKCAFLHVFLLLAILFTSFIIEILQAILIASRGAEWFDMLANFIGVSAAYAAFLVLGRWRLFRFLRL